MARKIAKKLRVSDIEFGTGAIQDPIDLRDRIYDGIAFGAAPFDWEKGYDIEKVINTKIPIKNQDGSLSCTGQSWSYFVAVLNTIETGIYTEVSAKAIYSQIAQPGGGASIRDGGKLIVDWGGISETIIHSYKDGDPPDESFIRDKSWINEQINNAAKKLIAKEYRMVSDITMEIIAQGIRDNYGVVGGVSGANNGTWGTLEPRPGNREWGHALYLGKAGIDEKGKYIATPNSWGDRFGGMWQKLRQDWFNNTYMFNPWLIVDQPNFDSANNELVDLIKQCEKGMVIENDPPGRKGIIYGGKLLEVLNGREGNAALYLLESKGIIKRISKDTFNKIPKGNSFF
jgi:hypothetical protein